MWVRRCAEKNCSGTLSLDRNLFFRESTLYARTLSTSRTRLLCCSRTSETKDNQNTDIDGRYSAEAVRSPPHLSGRGMAMSVASRPERAEVIRHNCGLPGHYERGCAMPRTNNGKSAAGRNCQSRGGSAKWQGGAKPKKYTALFAVADRSCELTLRVRS